MFFYYFQVSSHDIFVHHIKKIVRPLFFITDEIEQIIVVLCLYFSYFYI
jgi:hypothetical protein